MVIQSNAKSMMEAFRALAAGRRFQRAVWTAWALLAAIAVTGGLFLQGSYPIADNAMFSYVGRAIVHGHVLYVDVWDNKLPAIYYVNALWQMLFGERYLLHAVAETCVALLSGTLLAQVLRSFGLHDWLPAPIVLLVLLCLVLPLNATEAYALPLLLASILAVRRALPALAGVFVGIASIFWLPAVLMVVPLSLLVPRKVWLALGLGALAPLVALFAALVWSLHPSGLAMLLRSWTDYVTTPPVVAVHHRLPILNRIAPLTGALNNLWFGSIAAGAASLIAILFGTMHRPATQAQRFGLCWTAAMFAGTFAGTRFYTHYFIPSLAPMLFTIATFGVKKGRHVAFVLALGFALYFAILTVRDVRAIWISTEARSALVVRVAARMQPVVNGKLTLEVDSYRPDLYLALNPKLRGPYEIAAPAIGTFLREKVQTLRGADIRVSTTGDVEPGIRVCAKTSNPMRIFSSPGFASRFAECP